MPLSLTRNSKAPEPSLAAGFCMTRSEIFPPCGVYLMALETKLNNTWLRRSLSQCTKSFRTPAMSMVKSCPFAWTSAWTMSRSAWTMSASDSALSFSVILPDSMRLMSRMSLIRESRCSDDCEIVDRQSLTRSGSSMWVVASSVNPMIAFIGVRMSCDMLLRNVVLARLADCAICRASSRCPRSSDSCRRCFSMVSEYSFSSRFIAASLRLLAQ